MLNTGTDELESKFEEVENVLVQALNFKKGQITQNTIKAQLARQKNLSEGLIKLEVERYNTLGAIAKAEHTLNLLNQENVIIQEKQSVKKREIEILAKVVPHLKRARGLLSAIASASSACKPLKKSKTRKKFTRQVANQLKLIQEVNDGSHLASSFLASSFPE